MPTTLVSLVVFVIAALPGSVFVLTRRQRYPGLPQSVLREATQLVAMSLLGWLAAWGAAALLMWVGLRGPNVRELILATLPYIADHAALVTAWTVGGLCVATAVAAGVGRWAPAPRGLIRPSTAWWDCFRLEFDRCGAAAAHVRCLLTDGSQVGGILQSFTSQEITGMARELVLEQPLTFSRSGSEPELPLAGNRFIVAAERIEGTVVSYLELDPRVDTPPAEPLPPCAAGDEPPENAPVG